MGLLQKDIKMTEGHRGKSNRGTEKRGNSPGPFKLRSPIHLDAVGLLDDGMYCGQFFIKIKRRWA